MRVTLVHNEDGDWMGVYIDGELRYEGHSIQDDELLQAVGVEHGLLTAYMVDADMSRLPHNLADVPIIKPCKHELPEHGFLQEGDHARCSKCGVEFVRIHDESEGGYWLTRDGGQAV